MKFEPTERYSLLEELAARGVRLTSQRRMLIQTIEDSDGLPDAATLLERVRQRDPVHGAQIDRATVYRTLDLLRKLDLVGRSGLERLPRGRGFGGADSRADHIRLECFACGRLLEFRGPGLEALRQHIVRESGFDIRLIRVEAAGQCQACSRPQPPKG